MSARYGAALSDEVIDAYLRTARRMATRWCHSPADADDVAQEAVIRLVEQRQPPNSAEAWPSVVTRRLSHRQQLKRLSQEHADAAFADQKCSSVDPDLLLDVSSLLSRLNTRDRSLLIRVTEGAFSTELAMEFRCNSRDIGQMVARARRKARRERGVRRLTRS